MLPTTTSIVCNQVPQHLTSQVFDLLQLQWPIHVHTRRRGLEPQPNHTRVLVVTNSGLPDEAVVGHALVRWTTPAVCLVVSVVVHKDSRRQRIGRTLMLEVEGFVRRESQGPVTIYLWTTDQA
ncbi:hypothetical protein, variant [Aphanomyces astaci]|uniref:N-acetyltransferase domain-containing protein n=1 Tax=Aphanomyces astaci TaxID=112090 RepID=W4GGV5_APHAT|nr:hypothetical protein, variant [Aphanomyces astaci]ETV78912.1 hypothetical protein, variant [Aphanomyces astaci]|eukprot:XP_009831631.1 hypothetical protein, variant [Aphanomyces astaci]